jgi:hypothetical protein
MHLSYISLHVWGGKWNYNQPRECRQTSWEGPLEIKMVQSTFSRQLRELQSNMGRLYGKTPNTEEYLCASQVRRRVRYCDPDSGWLLLKF